MCLTCLSFAPTGKFVRVSPRRQIWKRNTTSAHCRGPQNRNNHFHMSRSETTPSLGYPAILTPSLFASVKIQTCVRYPCGCEVQVSHRRVFNARRVHQQSLYAQGFVIVPSHPNDPNGRRGCVIHLPAILAWPYCCVSCAILN